MMQQMFYISHKFSLVMANIDEIYSQDVSMTSSTKYSDVLLDFLLALGD